jgi:hypothetical protein
MTKDKKPKDDGNVRVIDPKDKMWKGIKNLTKGMSPQERSKFLIEFVESIPKVNSITSTKK